MSTERYILDDHGDPQPCEDLFTWGRWMQTAERHLAHDKDEGPDGLEIRISTVFLGLDHSFRAVSIAMGREPGPPVLWETMVFGGLLNGEQERYTSKADALRGHQLMCERVTASLGRRGDATAASD